MLGFADYVIIMLVVLGMAAACRHIWKSIRSGSCPGCSSCGQQLHTGKKKKSKEIPMSCCDGSKKESCNCGCSHCR